LKSDKKEAENSTTFKNPYYDMDSRFKSRGGLPVGFYEYYKQDYKRKL